jgi:predicted nucleic acid-binding protein
MQPLSRLPYPQNFSDLVDKRDRIRVNVQFSKKDEVENILFTENESLLDRLNRIEKLNLNKVITVVGTSYSICASLATPFLEALNLVTQTDKVIVPTLVLNQFLNDLEQNKKLEKGLKDHFFKHIKHDITIQEYRESILKERNFKEAYRYALYFTSFSDQTYAIDWICKAKTYLGNGHQLTENGCDLQLFFNKFSIIKDCRIFQEAYSEIRDAAACAPSITSMELKTDQAAPIIDRLVDFLEKTKTLVTLELKPLSHDGSEGFSTQIKKLAEGLKKNRSLTKVIFNLPQLLDADVIQLLGSIQENKKIEKVIFKCWQMTEKSALEGIETLKKCPHIVDMTFESTQIPTELQEKIEEITDQNKEAIQKEKEKTSPIKETQPSPKKTPKQREAFRSSIFSHPLILDETPPEKIEVKSESKSDD